MKYYKTYSFIFLAGLLISIASMSFASSKDYKSRTYDVSDFDRIHLEGGYHIYLIQGDIPSLKIESGDSDVFDHLDVSIRDGTLKIEVEEDHFSFKKIILHITFVELEELHIEGGVKLETKGYLDVEDLDVSIEGGANIEMDLKAENLTVKGEGGVLFELKGVAKSMRAKLSGAGHFNAGELKTENTDIKIEGVGTATVYATNELHGKIEGVGKIKYRGNPKVHKNIEGIGKITSY